MELTESVIQYLEEHIPELGDVAVRQAYWQALTSGNSVLVSLNGEITEMFPDGTSQLVKKTTPFVALPKGKIIPLK